jgi:glycosyltransferase involved in cell wall biosynthesis
LIKFIIIFYFYFIIKSIKIPKVSIIIPSYNIPKYEYLEKSINSILNQSFKNFELIVVDDNANDQTPIILDKYAFNYKRVIIIHKTKNELTGYSRNTGMDFVMGEYLGFLDYDDIFHIDAIKFAYFEAKKKNYTIVNFKYKSFKNESSILNYLQNRKKNYKIKILNANYNFPIKKTGIHVWRNIYKSSFIFSHNFKFYNTWSDEDVLFCLTVFSFEYEILLINKPLVFHRLLKTSVGHNNKKKKIRQKFILIYLRNIFKIFKQNNLINNRIRNNIFVLLAISHFKKNIEKLLRFIKSYKEIFRDNIVRNFYINIFKMKKIEKLYFYKENNINKYEIIIKNKINCFI